MSNIKERDTDFFIPNTCQLCSKPCKRELSIIFKKQFEDGKNDVICGKFSKAK